MVVKKKNRSFDAIVDAINTTRVVHDGERGGVGFRDGVVVPEPRSGGAGTTSADGVHQFDMLTSPSYAGVLNKFGLDGSKFMQLLAELGISTGRPMSDVQQDDWNKQLLNSMLAAASEQDARDFNIAMRDEQRIWDSPTNQLARLMGAGISRDAAIQLLSGGAAGSGAGSITGAAAPMSEGIPASQSTLNDTQGKTAIANTVFGGISAISGLVSLGFSVPQAIAQTQAMLIGNAMSQKALVGLQSADAVLGALQNAVSNGALSTADVDGFSNATDALNYIYDHKDTNAFKSIFENGAFANVYGTKLGRDMFAQAWDSVRQSKDGGTMLDNFIAQNIARTKLADLDIEKSYQELQYAIGELSRQDVEIQRLWNDVWEGNIRIEIAGQELKVKKYEGNRAETLNKVFDTVYNKKYDGAPDARDLGSGSNMLAYNMWSDLSMQFYKAFAQNGTKERRDAWERFFLNNNESAQLLAGLQLSMSRIQSSAANPELNPLTSTLISIWTLAKMTGAYDVLKLGVDASADAFPYVLTPNAPK